MWAPELPLIYKVYCSVLVLYVENFFLSPVSYFVIIPCYSYKPSSLIMDYFISVLVSALTWQKKIKTWYRARTYLQLTMMWTMKRMLKVPTTGETGNRVIFPLCNQVYPVCKQFLLTILWPCVMWEQIRMGTVGSPKHLKP